jgi:hypothetical protein
MPAFNYVLKSGIFRFTTIFTLLCGIGSRPALCTPVSGLYQIIGGSYSECCGIGGNAFVVSLPNQGQSFVRLNIDAQSNLASMTFLANDARTVLSTIPCLPSGQIDFNFEFGFVSGDELFFHVDPGAPPYGEYWSYSASNSVSGLRIDGMIGTTQSICADSPTRFTHSNVVAVLVPPPTVTLLDYSIDRGARLLLQGRSGWTNVLEGSTNLIDWAPISTNVMDFSLCPVCPFVMFQDAASTNLAWRYYRNFEFP